MAILAGLVLAWLLYRRRNTQAAFLALAVGGAALLNFGATTLVCFAAVLLGQAVARLITGA